VETMALERIKQQWLFAADSMPQLICLLDRGGRVLGANRTLERWQLNQVAAIRGTPLHQVLHRQCSDPNCYLRSFWQWTAAMLGRDGRTECEVWDPRLQRQLSIRVQMSPERNGTDADDFFAVAVIDDLTESKTSEGQSRQATQNLRQRVGYEERRRARAEQIQARLRTIMDRTPVFTALADHSGALFYVNPAGRALLGLAQEEDLSGLTLIDCQAPAARIRIAEEALPAAERDGVWSGDSVLYSRDQREIRSYLTLIAHRDVQGRLDGFSLLGRDMRDWVRTDEALQLMQNELWRLSAQHLTIQESERRRIAGDLHDGLGQTLSLVKLSIEEAARAASAGIQSKTLATLERLAPTVKTALAELRRISMNLRPATLDDLGILATLAWYFREFEASCPHIHFEHDISVKESDVPEPLKIAIFRIVQEATSNALKHAQAERIKVSLNNEDGSLELLIEDTGRGFDPEAAPAQADFSHGLGLQSMRERAELSGARYAIHSAPGKGTSICVRWPSPEAVERKLAALPLPSESFAINSTFRHRSMPERLSVCVVCMRNQGGT